MIKVNSKRISRINILQGKHFINVDYILIKHKLCREIFIFVKNKYIKLIKEKYLCSLLDKEKRERERKGSQAILNT